MYSSTKHTTERHCTLLQAFAELMLLYMGSKHIYVSIRSSAAAYVSIRLFEDIWDTCSSRGDREYIAYEREYEAYDREALHTNTFVCSGQHTTVSVSSYYYICVLILLYLRPHTTISAASHYCMRPHTTKCVCSAHAITYGVAIAVKQSYHTSKEAVKQ